MKKRVLITGAAGFIGFFLSRRLANDGYEVLGIDNLNDYYDVGLKMMRLERLKGIGNFSFRKADIANRPAISSIFASFMPDIVINLAAQAGVRYSIDHPDTYISSNIIGFYNILECCRSHPIEHLLFASSSSVYGANLKIPFSVEDKTDEPISLYAATKKSNELFAYCYSSLYGIPTTGLRFFTVYGPFGRPDMAYFKFADKIMNNMPIDVYNNGDMWRDFTYVGDIIEGISRLMLLAPGNVDGTKPRYKIFNIGNGHPEKLMDMIQILEGVLGKRAILHFLPMQPGDVYRTYADVGELQKVTGFRPSTSLTEGLTLFGKWYFTEYYNHKTNS